MKKIIAIAITASMILSSMIQVFADNKEAMESITNHWSKEYITYLNSKGVIMPAGDSFEPDSKISRVEVMRYINRAFSFEEKDIIYFSDIEAGKWYYDEVAKAVYWGYIQGTSANTMSPGSYITREEAVVIISRLHNLQPQENAYLSFTDTSKISNWSKPYVATAVELGYISGRPDGSFDPQGYITRGEMSKILYLFAGNILDKGVHLGSSLMKGNVTIGKDFTTLKDANIDGTVLITSDVESTLKNVSITGGDLIVSGGNVYLEDVSVENLIVKAPKNENTRLVIDENCDIENVILYSQSDIVQIEEDKGGVKNIVDKLIIAGNNMEFSGSFDKMEINSQMDLGLSNGMIDEINVTSKGDYIDIDLDNFDVEEMNLNARTVVTGDGEIDQVNIEADGVRINAKVRDYDIGRGYEATIDGDEVDGSGSGSSNNDDNDEDVLVSPSPIVLRHGDRIEEITLDVTFDLDDLEEITLENKVLKEGDDYELDNKRDEIILLEDLVDEMNGGDELTIEIYREDDIDIDIVYIDDDENYLNVSRIDVDLDDKDDLEVMLYPADNEDLDYIYNGNERLSSNDYDESGSKITIEYDYLKDLDDGKHTFKFKMSDGNDPKLDVYIDGNSNNNDDDENYLSEDRIDFYLDDDEDLVVTLYSDDDEELEYIYNEDEKLSSNDYDERGSKIYIEYDYLEDLDEGKHTFEFIMSGGNDPELDVYIEDGDSSDKNRVSPDDAKFSSDKNSRYYDDVEVTLYDEDGYLRDIYYDGDKLDDDDDYDVSGSRITIDRDFLYGERREDEIELKFEMSSGRDPILTIDMDSSDYDRITVTFIDDTGKELEDVEVILGGETEHTDDNGEVDFDVDPDRYIIEYSKEGYESDMQWIHANDGKTEFEIIMREN